ncbi:MAG: apolipoprotein N-acyltransferase [Ilumatobacteraceae bacterium]
MTRRLPGRGTIGAVAAGLLVALSLPPWGFWPLGIIGVAVFESSLGAAPSRGERLRRGWLFGAAWLYLGMCWMWFLTIPGYLIAAALFAALHAVAALVAPAGRWRVIARPAAHTLAEAIRFSLPFGGVPLASLPIGQASSPFAGIAGIGGVVLLTWCVFQAGFALAGPSPFVPQLARSRGVTARPEWLGVAALGIAVAAWGLSPLADSGVRDTGTQLRIAVVQGGGEQGTRAIYTSSAEVLQRHLNATADLAPGDADLVLWPENVIDVDGLPFEQSAAHDAIAAEAARLGVPFAVGVTEDSADGSAFLNAQVVVSPAGESVSRYEKVRRVPFGEYMPLRGALDALGAPVNLVPRDAVAGTGPAFIDLPDGTRLAVVISWEVFFGGRANEGVERGAALIVNPTNGSSYTWTVLQGQQVASSRLRAREQGRWVVQAAPTGFSAFVTPGGEVQQRTGVSERAVIIGDVALREGRTWYSRTGDAPWLAAMALVLAFAVWRARREARASEDNSG